MFKIVSLCLIYLLARCTLQCPDEKYCLECPAPKDGSEQICSRCENSFYNSAQKKCDTNIKDSIDHCKFYSHIGEKILCAVCDYGYFLDTSKNQCVGCKVEGCAQCNDSDVCFACFNKRMLNFNNNTCDKDKTCELPNCDVCINDNLVIKCVRCEGKFSLNNLIDRMCVQATSNCYLIDPSDSTKCLTCSYGYYITKDGTCSSNSSNMWWILLIAIPVVGLVVYLAYSRFKNRDNVDTYNAA